MRLTKFLNIDPLISEVCDDLFRLRRKRFGRAEAVTEIKKVYANELNDDDDSAFVLIGIALGMCKDCELIEEAAEDARGAISALSSLRPDLKEMLSELELYLHTPECFGPEKKHTSCIYDPEWKIGDTFCHLMTSDSSEQVGLKGKYILMRKCREYKDDKGYHVQLVNVTVCSEEDLPLNAGDVEKLGWIQMMPGGRIKSPPDYLAQICIKSRTHERKFALVYLGCFPILSTPDDHVPRDARAAMPFHGIMNDDVIDYERIVCMRYKSFGIHYNK